MLVQPHFAAKQRVTDLAAWLGVCVRLHMLQEVAAVIKLFAAVQAGLGLGMGAVYVSAELSAIGHNLSTVFA